MISDIKKLQCWYFLLSYMNLAYAHLLVVDPLLTAQDSDLKWQDIDISILATKCVSFSWIIIQCQLAIQGQRGKHFSLCYLNNDGTRSEKQG